MNAPAPTAVRVMLVEDHEPLRRILVLALETFGYRVTDFGSGTAALAALEAGAETDLLLTDVRMPGSPNGLELAEWVGVHRPGTRVLVQTGYSELPTGRFAVLRKPFTPDELAAALAAVLAAPPGAAPGPPAQSISWRAK
jgi:CheY-like chemotaxis protein